MKEYKNEILLILSLCIVTFFNVLNTPFICDDITGIKTNALFNNFQWIFLLKPTILINFLTVKIFGMDTLFFHLISLILHAINCVLLFFFLKLFFEKKASLLGSLLFAVLPIHAEAVSWISGRPYLFICLSFLLVFLLYQRKKYLASLLVFAYFSFDFFAFFALIPLILIIYDILFNGVRKQIIWWISFMGVSLIKVLNSLSLIDGRIIDTAKNIGSQNLTNPLHNAVYSIFVSLGLMVYPQNLTIYHEPTIINPVNLRLGIFAIVLILIVLFGYLLRKQKVLFLGVMIYLIFLLPTFSPISICWLVAERYIYVPSILFSILLAFFYTKTDKHKIIFPLLIFIIALYGARTIDRNTDYKTEERFWRETCRVSTLSPKARNNLGYVYAQEKNYRGALEEFKNSVILKPDYEDAKTNYRQIEELLKKERQ